MQCNSLPIKIKNIKYSLVISSKLPNQWKRPRSHCLSNNNLILENDLKKWVFPLKNQRSEYDNLITNWDWKYLIYNFNWSQKIIG